MVRDPTVPPFGLPVTGEVAQLVSTGNSPRIRDLLKPEKASPARLPTRRPNAHARRGRSHGGAGRFGAGTGSAAPSDDAFWAQGLGIGDPAVLADAQLPGEPAHRGHRRIARRWLSLGRPPVSMLVLPDGTVSYGLGALRRLTGLVPAANGSQGRAGRSARRGGSAGGRGRPEPLRRSLARASSAAEAPSSRWRPSGGGPR